MKSKAYIVNINDGRIREGDIKLKKESLKSVKKSKIATMPDKIIPITSETTTVTKNVTDNVNPPPFTTYNRSNININKPKKFTPTVAPPVPGKVNISTLKDITPNIPQKEVPKKPLIIPEGDFSNVENITRMEDGRVAVTRVFKSYEDALETVKPPKEKPKEAEPCNLCGSQFEKQGHKLVCPYCYYEKI